MAKVALRSYNTEIDRLIDNNQLDEAIAHCIHILGIYPRHVDTYRLLGKAFLERQRYNDAADMFLRVLAIFPDDFVAHIGISIVREELSDLNLAVFHMERAFEVQPTNTAIQDELKRLYGKRDGVAPAKIRLTHPALARLYSKGELNQQALGELSVAILDTPSRADILAQLAELYTREGQNDEAIQTCNKLIEQLPYCYGALNVLTRLLPGTPFAQDAPIYQARINELDPYFEFKSNINESSSDVQEDAVMIEPLVWSPDSELTVNKTDWITSLGLKLVEPAQVDPALFQKKAPVASYTQDETPTVPRIRSTATPTSPQSSSFNVMSPEIQSGSEPTPPADLPEWMQSAGWSKSDGSESIAGSGGQAEGTPTMPSIEKIRRDTDHLPPLPRDTGHLPSDPTVEKENVTGETGSLEPASTLEPGSIPEWVRSIAPPDLTGSEPEPSSGADSISEQAIDDAFSAIFPSIQPQENSRPNNTRESSPEIPVVPVQGEPVPTDLKAGREDTPSTTVDADNTFSLDDLRKEMDMVSDLPNDAESAATPEDFMSESMENGSAIDDLRKSFHTEEIHPGGESMPEDDLINKEAVSPPEPSEMITSAQDVVPEDAETPQQTQAAPPSDTSQVEIPVEEVSTPVEEIQTVPESAAEPIKAVEMEIPVWLRNLGDGQAPTDEKQIKAAEEELPAWLQDFEQKIEGPLAPPTELPPSEPGKVSSPSGPDEKVDWRQNLPPKSESKFHTTELPAIPGLDLTETPDQYEVELPAKTEPSAPEETSEPIPASIADEYKAPAPVFSGGETTIIAAPTPKVEPEEDERPAWLSKLIGIDDIETPTPVKPEKLPSQEAQAGRTPENIDEIAGAMQAAWMMDLMSEKKSEDQASAGPASREIPPDSALQKETPVESQVPPAIPVAEETTPPAQEAVISDIDKMFEGIQAEMPQPPVEPEQVIPEMPTVPVTPAQVESDLGQLIGDLRAGPDTESVEAVPPIPAPSIPIEAAPEDDTDSVSFLEDLNRGTVPPAFESEPVPPAPEIIPEPRVKATAEDLEDIPDLIRMVDDLKAEPEQMRPTPVPAEPQSPAPPGETPAGQSGDSDDVPDLSLIVEGLQAAWMSEHGDDGEVKHTGKLHDIYVPPSGSNSSETIIMRRPGAEPVVPQAETSNSEGPPPADEPEPVLPVANQDTIQPVVEQVIEPVPEPVIAMDQEQVTSQPEPPRVVAEPQETIPQASRIVPEPSSRPARQSPVTPSISPEDILQDARAAFSHGVLDEALDRYLDLIARNRLIESVIEDLESMTSAQGEQSDIWQALGDAYTRRNQLDQALSAYLRAEELLK